MTIEELYDNEEYCPTCKDSASLDETNSNWICTNFACPKGNPYDESISDIIKPVKKTL